jgi:hypothetical protein
MQPLPPHCLYFLDHLEGAAARFCKCQQVITSQQGITSLKTNIYLIRPQFGVVYGTEALWLIVPLTPKEVPSFISRGAAHHTVCSASTSKGRNYVKEILLPV